MKNKKNKLSISTLVVVIFLFVFQSAYGATLYFSPSAGNFTVGNIFTVSALVNTENKAINNSEGVISFPSDLLEVVSVSKSSSIFSLWVDEPSFSNSSGRISFNGGLPTPGFNGTAGSILSTVFRVKKEGSASLFFSSAAVRANDGFGTDVLNNSVQAQFNLISEERPVQPTPVVIGAPKAPQISSPTHPNQTSWYSKNEATFNWPIGEDITAVKLLVGRSANADPVVVYIPSIDKKTISNFEDGIWYFNAQLKNNNDWGGVGRFRFQIDTKNPDRFDIQLVERYDPTEPKVKFIFNAHDELSGIDHYEVQIDSGSFVIWYDNDNKHIYETAELGPGKHVLTAKAFDKAGNFLTSSIEFDIEGLNPPVISEYPKEIETSQILILRGESYTDSQIIVWVQGEKDEAKKYTGKSDKNGNFTFLIDEKFKDGTYQLWAEVIDYRGAKSGPSEKIVIVVKQSTFLRIGSLAITVLAVIIPLIILLLFLLLILWYAWRKFSQLRKRLRKEVSEAEAALHKAFDLLKEDIHEQIKMLEEAKYRRSLTKEEEKIIKQLKKDLDEAEKFIRKEIQDIEREIK